MDDKRLRLKEAVIVEGKYDRIKLSSLIATPVLETGGFRVFRDKDRQRLIREVAQRRGILMMTDSDGAGFVIRNFLSGIVEKDQIKHCYIPQIAGKEKRKDAPSKEGLLGVEGVDIATLKEAILRSGATILGEEEKPPHDGVTPYDFYMLGLLGNKNARGYREKVLFSLGLPKYLSAKAMMDAVSCLFTKDEFEEYVKSLQSAECKVQSE